MRQDINPASERSEQLYISTGVRRPEHGEGSVTRLIEHQAAKIPSDAFLLSALCSMAGSFLLEIAGKRRWSRFVGFWPGPLLTMGVYNKLVKTLGPS